LARFDRDDEGLNAILKKEINMDPKELGQAFAAFKTAQEQANEAVKLMAKEIEKGSKEGIAAAMAKAEAAAVQVQALADRMVEAEQKLVKNIMSGKSSVQSIGQIYTASDEYKAFASGNASRARLEIKGGFRPQANTITGQSGSPATNSDVLVGADRMAGIVGGAFRALRVRDVLPSGLTTSNMIEFTRELVFTNNAAEVAEGGTKAESVLTFELATAPVVTIAHWIKVSKQVLSDAPALAAYIDNRLRYGVELRVDSQLINGNGSGQNMKGLAHADNQTEYTPVSGDTEIDSINRAKQTLAVADYAATALMLNPATWGAIERKKDDNERYVVGNPFGAIVPVMWGLPVVVTNSITAGKLLIGAFDVAAMVFGRESVSVEMSNSNDTDFVKNLITVRAEERLALAGLRPASILYGDLTV
jgi:HK97 family phage major capsid protein